MSQSQRAKNNPNPFVGHQHIYQYLNGMLNGKHRIFSNEEFASGDLPVTCRETPDHSILEALPVIHVCSILPTEVFRRHVVQT